MDSLTVMHNVPVKVVMTESFRVQVVEQIRSSLAELDQESARLNEFLTQAAEEAFRMRLQEELQRVAYQKQQLEWRIKEAESVAEGAELFFQTLPSQLVLKVGDNIQEKMGVEVLLKDWKIVEIRGGTA
ncbi:MAG: YlqD family protein [Vulcanimicrobiota bacterium]